MLVLVGMDSHGITHSFWYFHLQILGAFAVRDGVPMQGMKIKNVVPGKNSVTLWNCLGQLIANMSLDISLLRHFETPHSFFFLGCFCCPRSVWTRSVKKEGGVLLVLSVFMSEDAGSSSAIRGFIKDSTLGALESDMQCQSRKICDKWLTEFVLQGVFI